MKLAARLDYWTRAWCPHCQKPNMVSGGDPDDQTRMDLCVVQCWSCKESFALFEPDDQNEDPTEGIRWDRK